MRGKNQKLKLLFLAKIMQEQTDDTHMLTMSQIIDELAKYDIEAQRKSVYDDLAALNFYGIEIIKYQEFGKTFYYCGARDFELAELHIIIDAIASSKFITEKKSKELIEKLEHMASNYDAKLIDRDVYVSGRVKNMNESIFYTVDAIQNAIANNHRITFQYFSWNVDKEMELKHDGKVYDISPWALLWDNENYYLLGYDNEVKDFKHYRVDKMLHTEETKDKRQGEAKFNKLDKEIYTKKHFRMFGGEEERISLLCKNEMANVIIDQFGRDVTLRKVDEEHFKVNVDVVVSNQFLSWVIALEGNVMIIGPDNVKEELKELLKKKYMD
ncbi:MAG: WYL domain-containing protein [Eubacterium sp.]|nr:WYL domain-containing protein [Eubacterium sp.]